MASRLDAATSVDAGTHTFSISAGSNRVLIVGVEQEGDGSAAPTCTYGGQSMTEVIDLLINPGSTSQRVTLFYLNDAGIVAASSTTIVITGEVDGQTGIHAASYQDAQQTTPTNIDSDSTTSGTPNPLTDCEIITGAADAIVVALAGNGEIRTASWASPVTEQTDLQVNPPGGNTGSLADDEVPSATTIPTDCTWSGQNRAVVVACELVNVGGRIMSSLAGSGGLAGPGGIVGPGGGLAG